MMHVILSPSWILTDEHGASNEGVPVMVNRKTNEVYGPEDTIRIYPSSRLVPAPRAVNILLEHTKMELTKEETAFMRAFFLM
jgi:hypothetical protein